MIFRYVNIATAYALMLGNLLMIADQWQYNKKHFSIIIAISIRSEKISIYNDKSDFYQK